MFDVKFISKMLYHGFKHTSRMFVKVKKKIVRYFFVVMGIMIS